MESIYVFLYLILSPLLIVTYALITPFLFIFFGKKGVTNTWSKMLDTLNANWSYFFPYIKFVDISKGIFDFISNVVLHIIYIMYFLIALAGLVIYIKYIWTTF